MMASPFSFDPLIKNHPEYASSAAKPSSADNDVSVYLLKSIQSCLHLILK